jgi:hypothetical protein
MSSGHSSTSIIISVTDWNIKWRENLFGVRPLIPILDHVKLFVEQAPKTSRENSILKTIRQEEAPVQAPMRLNYDDTTIKSAELIRCQYILHIIHHGVLFVGPEFNELYYSLLLYAKESGCINNNNSSIHRHCSPSLNLN